MSKPRPPSYNPKILQKRLSVMEVAKNRFNMLDEHRKKDELPTTYITLEGLSFFQASREQGYSDEELREAWCESWGKEEVIVPAALLNTKWSDRSKRKSTKYLARIAKNQTVMVVCNP
ncbi:hypothetical protein OAS66_03610 [Alphaproteobacteria bacterium]|nr:hypothetical protein [Alphaproteobacteria bacterium]